MHKNDRAKFNEVKEQYSRTLKTKGGPMWMLRNEMEFLFLLIDLQEQSIAKLDLMQEHNKTQVEAEKMLDIEAIET